MQTFKNTAFGLAYGGTDCNWRKDSVAGACANICAAGTAPSRNTGMAATAKWIGPSSTCHSFMSASFFQTIGPCYGGIISFRIAFDNWVTILMNGKIVYSPTDAIDAACNNVPFSCYTYVTADVSSVSNNTLQVIVTQDGVSSSTNPGGFSLYFVTNCGNSASPIIQRNLTNMVVVSNVPSVGSYSSDLGRIELGATCSSPAASMGNNSLFDYSDTPTGPFGCSGFFQIHDLNAKKTLLAWNNFANKSISVKPPDVGLGTNEPSNPLYNPTFSTVNSFALSLNSSRSQFVQTPAAKWFNSGAFTIEAWVKVRSVAFWNRIIDFYAVQENSYIIIAASEDTGGKPILHIVRRSNFVCVLRSPSALPLNVWTHVAVTVDRLGNATMFLNGVKASVATALSSPDPVFYTANFIGRSNYIADGYFDGFMDELRIWYLSYYFDLCSSSVLF